MQAIVQVTYRQECSSYTLDTGYKSYLYTCIKITQALGRGYKYSQTPSNGPSEKWTTSLTVDRQLVTDLAIYTALIYIEQTSESGQPLYNGQNLCSRFVHCREVPHNAVSNRSIKYKYFGTTERNLSVIQHSLTHSPASCRCVSCR